MSARREEKEQSKQRKIVVKLEMRNKQQTNLKIWEEMEMWNKVAKSKAYVETKESKWGGKKKD